MGRRRKVASPTESGPVMLQVSFRHALAFGPGKARLLEAIASGGSITVAARTLGMSYKRAWSLIGEMNAAFVQPLVDLHAGGPNGGGASITDLGRDVLERYRSLERGVRDAISTDLWDFVQLMPPQDPAGADHATADRPAADAPEDA